jgi:hypothetical protein
MNRQERNKQKKKMAREERLRQERHQQRAQREKPAAPVSTPRSFVPTSQSGQSTGAQIAGEAQPASSPQATPERDSSGSYVPNGPLDNFFKGDPAGKWLDELLAGTDAFRIVQALYPAHDLPAELMLKASVCCEMLVAAELVAAATGQPSRHLPPEVAAWLLKQQPSFTPGVVRLAAEAVQRVGEFSELRQLWDTVRLGQEWLVGVKELHSRLQRG